MEETTPDRPWPSHPPGRNRGLVGGAAADATVSPTLFFLVETRGLAAADVATPMWRQRAATAALRDKATRWWLQASWTQCRSVSRIWWRLLSRTPWSGCELSICVERSNEMIVIFPRAYSLVHSALLRDARAYLGHSRGDSQRLQAR